MASMRQLINLIESTSAPPGPNTPSNFLAELAQIVEDQDQDAPTSTADAQIVEDQDQDQDDAQIAEDQDQDAPTSTAFDAQMSGSTKPSIGPANAPTMADAWDYNASAAGNFVADQRAQAEQQGLYNPTSGVTPRGMMDMAKRVASIR